MKNSRGIALACLVAGIFGWGCENDINEIKAFTEKKISVEEGIQIESYMSEDAKVKARLTAPIMKRYLTDSPYVEFPKSLHVDFYNDSIKIESQLNARYGRYKESEHKVFLKDSVVIFNIQGDTLYCRELWWNQQTQKLYTDKPVRMARKDNTLIYGLFGLEATQTLKDVVFFSSSGHLPVQNQGLD